MPTDPPKAPVGLRTPGRRLWASVVGPYVLTPAELAILEQAARTADECDRLEKAARTSELVAPGYKGQPRAHPIFGEIRAHRALLGRLIGALNLPDEDQKLGLRAGSRHARKAGAARWSRRKDGHTPEAAGRDGAS